MILWKWLKNCIEWDSHYNKSWSQEGEDRILKRFFEQKTSHGFYVDVGAHHPFLFSNTKMFYDMGWNGINIDAMPDSMKVFHKYRPRDVNLEVGVGLKKEKKKYHIFNHNAVNSFSKELVLQRKEKYPEFKLQRTEVLQIVPLSSILDQYLIDGKKIDFMTIDVEGLDFDVIKSNDWSKYRPHIVLVELDIMSLESLDKNEMINFMKNIDYDVFAKTINTTFFLNKDI